MLKSDNLDALLSFYRGLMTGAERSRFAGALLQRLDGKFKDTSTFPTLEPVPFPGFFET